MGPLNKDYPTPARLAAPYNNYTRVGTSGTKTVGVVINCFDCHNAPTTPLTNRTVAAHGNANTIRGTIYVASPTLCTTCHLSYNTTNPGHGGGSAFTITDSNMGATQMYSCDFCHSSYRAAPRPIRAQDYHGNSVVPTGTVTKTGRWTSGVAGQNVTISFVRNSSNIANHAPKSVAGTAYTPACMGGNTGGSQNSCNQSNKTYTPGGTY